MTAAAEFRGLVSGGRLPAAEERELSALLARMEGKPVVVTVKEVKRRRSNDQNGYYWGVVVPAVTAMFRDAGNYVDENDTHEFLKLRVGKISRVIVTPDGEVHKSLGSTAKLSVSEFADYVARVRAWAAEHGCDIPEPNEVPS